MGKAIYTTRDKMKAVLLQSELRAEGIETIVVYGTAPSTGAALIDMLAGTNLDSSWQIVAHDQDVLQATEFLKMREGEKSSNNDILTSS